MARVVELHPVVQLYMICMLCGSWLIRYAGTTNLKTSKMVEESDDNFTCGSWQSSRGGPSFINDINDVLQTVHPDPSFFIPRFIRLLKNSAERAFDTRPPVISCTSFVDTWSGEIESRGRRRQKPPAKAPARNLHKLTQPMDPEKKSLNFIFPTKYVIPKSLKFSHWPSK